MKVAYIILLLLAGEGWGEGGYNFPLTVALRHPAFPNLCKVEQDFILSPWGKDRNVFLSN
jgi:hypothetical protein